MLTKLFVICLSLFSVTTRPLGAQTSTPSTQKESASQMTEHFRIYTATGQPATIGDVTTAMANAEVVFIGENHDDSTAHELEAELLRHAFEKLASSPAASKRQCTLSLEMFERDVQLVLNEYLAGLISEKQFLNDSRPWNNYQSDYRPLIEYARANRLPVIAANAPRRYVNRVSRIGRASLDVLSPQAREFLAPLPYAEASQAYKAKFNQLMGGGESQSHTTPQQPSGHSTSRTAAAPGTNNILDAQSLWDATMAYAIAEQLKRAPQSLVLHVSGKFHSEGHLGTPEHLLRYRPNTRLMVVTIFSDESYPNYTTARMMNLGDFVIVTDPSLPRSQ